MYVVQSLVYRLSTEERINKKKNKIPPTTRVKPSSIRGKTSLFPDEKHISLTSRHIFSQEITHLLWGCDVSGGFGIYLIVYFQLLQRWVEGLAVKAQTRTMILFSSFRHRSLPLFTAPGVQVPRHGEHLSGREVLSIFLNMPERISVRQTWSWHIHPAHVPHCRPDSTSKLPSMKV